MLLRRIFIFFSSNQAVFPRKRKSAMLLLPVWHEQQVRAQLSSAEGKGERGCEVGWWDVPKRCVPVRIFRDTRSPTLIVLKTESPWIDTSLSLCVIQYVQYLWCIITEMYQRWDAVFLGRFIMGTRGRRKFFQRNRLGWRWARLRLTGFLEGLATFGEIVLQQKVRHKKLKPFMTKGKKFNISWIFC